MKNAPGKSSNVGAGAAGVGGGTLIVLIANNLPSDSAIKPWLLLLSPAASVSLSALWLWLRIEIANYVQDNRVKSLAKAAKSALEEALQNPHTSDGHKSRIREQLEEVESLLATRHLTKLKDLRPVTASDVLDFERLKI